MKHHDLLFDALAATHQIGLRTQLAHWNITGPNFIAIHELLGAQYTDQQDGKDALAERARHLNLVIPGKVLSGSPKQPLNESTAWKPLLEHLVEAQNSLLETLHKLEASASSGGDPGTADLATERIRTHHEQLWMLRSHLA